jgi:GNAT superfamily N-acetyltransferase
MASDIQIRRAAPEDAPHLHRLILDLAAHERLDHVVEATAQDLERCLGSTAAFEALLAWRGIHMVGYAGLVYSFSLFTAAPTLIVDNLYVAETARGAGIGRRLMAAAAERARDRGCRRIELTVAPRNAAARRFYQGLGFVALDEAPLRLSGDALAALGDRARRTKAPA